MDTLLIILAFSAIVWYIIDRAKPLYEHLSFSKWITIGLAVVLSAACVFCFGIDLIAALTLTSEVTILGQILTVLIFVTGSSGISEVIAMIKNKQ